MSEDDVHDSLRYITPLPEHDPDGEEELIAMLDRERARRIARGPIHTPETFLRLRAFANDGIANSDEMNTAFDCVRAVCPDFEFGYVGKELRATFTLLDGAIKEVRGATRQEILARAAQVIVGRDLASDLSSE
jgi:hypothetical protein